MQRNQIALTSVLTIRTYQTSDGYVALRTAEGIDARGVIAAKAFDAAHRAVDAIRAGARMSERSSEPK